MTQLALVSEQLAALADLPIEDHVPAYDAIHRLLQDALAALDGD